VSSKATDEMYRRLLRIFDAEGYKDSKAVLEWSIMELMKDGRTREEAIFHIYAHEEEKERQEIAVRGGRSLVDQQVKQLEEKIGRLTILFSKGEIGEEGYKTALKTLEEELLNLKPQAKEWRGTPNVLWLFLPLLFGILGGVIAYVGVKNYDKRRALNLLLLGIATTVIGTVIAIWWFF
jgi:hypothetical protein